MDQLTWVVTANVAVWLGLGFYLFFLSHKQNKLARRLKRLEKKDHA
ncbi:MAG: CcmD family protein [Desulfovibrionaceae bacterium]|nr:CcmD family protein [Desulfovibrionaceae bacterium]